MKGLYVHIPFCEKICTYCDFCKRVAKDEQMIWDYLYTLKQEYNNLKDKSFTTIYIGGGTPSLLNISQLTFLFNIFKEEKPIEYTIEVNPETYTKEKGLLFVEYGVNRVSLGVQTFNEKILRTLNRAHLNKEVFFTIDHLNEIGLTNISLDLIFSLPNQTLADVKADLAIIKDLKIKHLSYYSLILEEKTVLYQQYLKGIFKPNSSDLEASMFKEVIKSLKSYGFNHYEVSNFAKDNKESLHNKLYWTIKPYEAIGAGSFGFRENYRYYHSSNVTNYIKNPIICLEDEPLYQSYQNTLIFGLRILNGISLTNIKNTFNRNPLVDFPKLNNFIENGLLTLNKDILKVTNKGLFLLNKIVEEYIKNF